MQAGLLDLCVLVKERTSMRAFRRMAAAVLQHVDVLFLSVARSLVRSLVPPFLVRLRPAAEVAA